VSVAATGNGRVGRDFIGGNRGDRERTGRSTVRSVPGWDGGLPQPLAQIGVGSFLTFVSFCGADPWQWHSLDACAHACLTIQPRNHTCFT
jgi:hypothetical protein